MLGLILGNYHPYPSSGEAFKPKKSNMTNTPQKGNRACDLAQNPVSEEYTLNHIKNPGTI